MNEETEKNTMQIEHNGTAVSDDLATFNKEVDSHLNSIKSNTIETMERVIKLYDQYYQPLPKDTEELIDEFTPVVTNLWSDLDPKQLFNLVPMMLNGLISPLFSYQYIALQFFIGCGRELIDIYYLFSQSHWDEIIKKLFDLADQDDQRDKPDPRHIRYLCAHDALSELLIPLGDQIKVKDLGRLIEVVFDRIFCYHPSEDTYELSEYILEYYQLIFSRLIIPFQSYPKEIRLLLEDRFKALSLALRRKPDINLHENLIDAIACYIVEKNKTFLPTNEFQQYVEKNPDQDQENNGFFKLYTACFIKLSEHQKIMLLRRLKVDDKKGMPPKAINCLLESLDKNTFFKEADVAPPALTLICSCKDNAGQIMWRVYQKEEEYLLFERHTVGALNNYWVQSAESPISSLSDNGLSILGAIHLANAQKNNVNKPCLWSEYQSLLPRVHPLLDEITKEKPISFALINLHNLTKAEMSEWLASSLIDKERLISEATDMQREILKRIMHDEYFFSEEKLRKPASEVLKLLHPQVPDTPVAVMMEEIANFKIYPKLKQSFYRALSNDFMDEALNINAIIDLLLYVEKTYEDDCDSYEEDDVKIKHRHAIINRALANALMNSQICLYKAQAKALISLIEHTYLKYDKITPLEMVSIFMFLHASASQEPSIIQLILYSIQNIERKVTAENLDAYMAERATDHLYCFFMILLNSLHTKNHCLEFLYSKLLHFYHSQYERQPSLVHSAELPRFLSNMEMCFYLPLDSERPPFSGFKWIASQLLWEINHVKTPTDYRTSDQSNMSFIDRITEIKNNHKNHQIRALSNHIEEDYQTLQKPRESATFNSSEEDIYNKNTKINLTEWLIKISSRPLTAEQSETIITLAYISSLMYCSYQTSPLVKLFFNKDIFGRILSFLNDSDMVRLLSLNYLTRQVVFEHLNENLINNRGIKRSTNNSYCLFFKKTTYVCKSDGCDGPLWKNIDSDKKLNP
ncbi:MAG: hypothetical protein K2X50_09145 [Gammaproteobacteria bacterium]|nr:hypothetical protein [Gammaproteobacteria bacterium]